MTFSTALACATLLGDQAVTPVPAPAEVKPVVGFDCSFLWAHAPVATGMAAETLGGASKGVRSSSSKWRPITRGGAGRGEMAAAEADTWRVRSDLADMAVGRS